MPSHRAPWDRRFCDNARLSAVTSAGPESGRFTADPFAAGSVPLVTTEAAAAARPIVEAVPAVLVGANLRSTFGGAGKAARLVRRITVQATTATAAYVYVGDVRPENLVSGTRTGNFDENDTSQPIFVPEGTTMAVEWQTSAGTALARIEYVEI